MKRQLKARVSAVVIGAAVLVACVGGTSPVEIVDVNRVSDSSLEIEVASCGGEPVATTATSETGELRVSVEVRDGNQGDDCLDVVVIETSLSGPLVVLDETSGATFSVVRGRVDRSG